MFVCQILNGFQRLAQTAEQKGVILDFNNPKYSGETSPKNFSPKPEFQSYPWISTTISEQQVTAGATLCRIQ